MALWGGHSSILSEKRGLKGRASVYRYDCRKHSSAQVITVRVGQNQCIDVEMPPYCSSRLASSRCNGRPVVGGFQVASSRREDVCVILAHASAYFLDFYAQLGARVEDLFREVRPHLPIFQRPYVL